MAGPRLRRRRFVEDEDGGSPATAIDVDARRHGWIEDVDDDPGDGPAPPPRPARRAGHFRCPSDSDDEPDGADANGGRSGADASGRWFGVDPLAPRDADDARLAARVAAAPELFRAVAQTPAVCAAAVRARPALLARVEPDAIGHAAYALVCAEAIGAGGTLEHMRGDAVAPGVAEALCRSAVLGGRVHELAPARELLQPDAYRRLALDAVRRDGRALAFAGPLRRDREVCLAAIAGDARAVAHADPAAPCYAAVARAAVERDPAVALAALPRQTPALCEAAVAGAPAALAEVRRLRPLVLRGGEGYLTLCRRALRADPAALRFVEPSFFTTAVVNAERFAPSYYAACRFAVAARADALRFVRQDYVSDEQLVALFALAVPRDAALADLAPPHLRAAARIHVRNY